DPIDAKRVFVELTRHRAYDIVVDVKISPGDELRRLHAAALGDYCEPASQTAGNSERTASALLFFASPDRRRPSISAENRMSLAVNLGKNSEKQRDCSFSSCAGGRAGLRQQPRGTIDPPATATQMRPASRRAWCRSCRDRRRRS